MRFFGRWRLATSAFFALVTVALCVLWVRSYFFGEIWEVRTTSDLYQVHSKVGRIAFWQQSPNPGPHSQLLLDELSLGRSFSSFEVKNPSWERLGERGRLGFEFYGDRNARRIVVPFWFLVCVPIGLAIVPWSFGVRRFSLRTLLITTTMLAVTLGVAVWAAR